MSNPELDLHGIRHHEVDAMVENFVFKHQYELPALIMCGNSNEMIKIAKETLERIDCKFDDARFGLIRVFEI